jgi:hypothetical protein
VSKAPPDGYTLLLAPSTFSIAQLVLKTNGASGYDVLNGFTPIVQTGSQPLFLVASATQRLRQPERRGGRREGHQQVALVCKPRQRLADAHPGRDVRPCGRAPTWRTCRTRAWRPPSTTCWAAMCR